MICVLGYIMLLQLVVVAVVWLRLKYIDKYNRN